MSKSQARPKNQFRETKIKNLIVIVSVFALLFVVSSYLFYNDYKKSLVQEVAKKYELNMHFLNEIIETSLIDNNRNKVAAKVGDVIASNLFESITLRYEKFIFNKEALVSNTPIFSDLSWKLAEVTVDARYGYIKKLPNALYEFIPSNEFDPNNEIILRYQVYKKGEIKNYLTKLNFNNLIVKNSMEKTYVASFIYSLIEFKLPADVFELKIDNNPFAVLTYKIDKYDLASELQSFMVKLFFFTFIMFLPIVFLILFYHKIIFKKYVTKPIDYLNKYLEDIISNKFISIDKNNFEGTDEIVELTKKINKISSKVASLTNELNISKDNLEKRISTDSLTGLPNKTVFDFDIKGMFVSGTKAYILLIRIDELSKLSANHDSGYINSFIESYVNIVKNIVFKRSKTNNKLYRFYGSQFALIAKDASQEEIQEICEEITEELLDRLPDFFDTPDDLVQMGATAFDLYGSLDGIVKSLNDAYELAKEKGPNSYHIVSQKDLEQKYSVLDKSVLEVIDNGNFDVDFVLETFLFDEPEKVFMKEVAPQVYDHENKKISIGSFVSVAQKHDIVDKFDKLVIEKSIEYLKQSQENVKLAVNLSMHSVVNAKFMRWLETYLKEENSFYLNQIVFSITSYTAYSHKSDFVKFVSDVHEIGAKVLLKRYKTDEYPLEQLEKLNLDYLRMNKDYTTNFTTDVVKKHKVKNILIFGDLNGIEIIADSVVIESDYNMLERLGAYATSK